MHIWWWGRLQFKPWHSSLPPLNSHSSHETLVQRLCGSWGGALAARVWCLPRSSRRCSAQGSHWTKTRRTQNIKECSSSTVWLPICLKVVLGCHCIQKYESCSISIDLFILFVSNHMHSGSQLNKPYGHTDLGQHWPKYRKVSNIRRTKSQNLNASRLIL